MKPTLTATCWGFVFVALTSAEGSAIVPGSNADAVLQDDIRAALEKREAAARQDCKLEIVAAEHRPIGQSVAYAKVSGDLKATMDRALRQDFLHVETWHASSCGEPVDYEVLLFRSSDGGTDIMAERLDAAPAAPTAPAAAPAGYETYQGLKEQFTIELPSGWHVVDQNAVIGQPGPYGVVVFSAQETGIGKRLEPAESEAMMATMRKISTGEIPSFIVERSPNQKGRVCAGYDKKAVKKVTGIMSDPAAMGRGAKLVGAPATEVVPVGGCTGVKVNARFLSSAGTPESLLVYSVSDGRIDYDIGLRGEDGFFEANRADFEKAVASIRLTAAK